MVTLLRDDGSNAVLVSSGSPFDWGESSAEESRLALAEKIICEFTAGEGGMRKVKVMASYLSKVHPSGFVAYREIIQEWLGTKREKDSTFLPFHLVRRTHPGAPPRKW